MSRFIFLFVSTIFFLNFAHGASFDCKKASTTVEKIICSDPALGKLDEVLASNYSNMGAADIGDGARNALKSTQKTWISQRNKCLDSACLTSSYEKRIDEICAYPVLTGMHPDCTGSSELRTAKPVVQPRK